MPDVWPSGVLPVLGWGKGVGRGIREGLFDEQIVKIVMKSGLTMSGKKWLSENVAGYQAWVPPSPPPPTDDSVFFSTYKEARATA